METMYTFDIERWLSSTAGKSERHSAVLDSHARWTSAVSPFCLISSFRTPRIRSEADGKVATAERA